MLCRAAAAVEGRESKRDAPSPPQSSVGPASTCIYTPPPNPKPRESIQPRPEQSASLAADSYAFGHGFNYSSSLAYEGVISIFVALSPPDGTAAASILNQSGR